MKIIFAFAALCACVLLAGCASKPPPSTTALQPPEIDASKNFLFRHYVGADNIRVSIYNISGEGVFVKIPLHGLSFDMEYVTTNGVRQNLYGSITFTHGGRYLLHFLQPVRPPDDTYKGVPCCTDLALKIAKPDDLESIIWIGCNINFIKGSEMRDIQNEYDFSKKLYANRATLRNENPNVNFNDEEYDDDEIPPPPPDFISFERKKNPVGHLELHR